MYNDEEEIGEQDQNSLPLKSKKCLRKKLTNLDSMIENEDDFGKIGGFSKPKITLTADTPRQVLIKRHLYLCVHSTPLIISI